MVGCVKAANGTLLSRMPAARPADSSIFEDSRKRAIAAASWQDMPLGNEYTISARIHSLRRSRARDLRSQLSTRCVDYTRWVCGFNVQRPISKRTLSFPAAVVRLNLLYANMHLVANAYIFDHIGMEGGSSRLDHHSKSTQWDDGDLL